MSKYTANIMREFGLLKEEPKGPPPHKFAPCTRYEHDQCTRAHFTEDGYRVRCTCTCHVQSDLFGAPPSAQRSLFK